MTVATPAAPAAVRALHLRAWEAGALERGELNTIRRLATGDRCQLGRVGDRLWVAEPFWVKHDTEWDECSGSSIDWGWAPHLVADYLDHQFVGSPENPARPDEPGWWMHPLPDDPPITQAFIDEFGDPGPPPWWISWKDEDSPFSKVSAALMPKEISRFTVEIVAVRRERLHEAAAGLDEAAPASAWEALAAFMRHWNGEHPRRARWEANPWVWVVDLVVVPEPETLTEDPDE